VRIGLPKGRLIGISERALRGLGIERDSASVYRLRGEDVTVWLLKMCDIPRLVEAGDLDIGIAPDEWIEEAGPSCQRIASFDGYTTRVSVLAPGDSPNGIGADGELRVATSFPNVARRFLASRTPNLGVVEVHGSAEAYPPELADVVVDCVETGGTAREHGLVEVESLLESRLHLITRAIVPGAVEEVAERLIRILDGSRNGDLAGARPKAVRLHELPPYLRAGLLACVREGGPRPIEGVGPVEVPRRDDGDPVYITVWDRELELSIPPGVDARRLQEALEAHLAGGGLRRDAPDLFTLVVLLALWDDLIREVGLYTGRVYMASEEATRSLLPLAGVDAPPPEQFTQLLLEAQALELMYRFPVAYKFRRSYGLENQCRLNGWGRRLARRALKHDASRRESEEWRERLRRHLEQHADAYRHHIEHVGSEGLATAPADSWTLSARLPVPILL
jgi:ATP phosphoribosyltransferase